MQNAGIRRNANILLLPLLGLLSLGPKPAIASDSADVELRLKAAYIYNFARFVEWPPRSSPGPLRICVLGHGDLMAPLQDAVRGKSAGGRPVTVTAVSSPAEAECCEILLIENSESKHFSEIVQSLADKPVLTVCDDINGFRNGIMIGFRLVDESIRFQINQEAAGRAGLKISSQLLKVAVPQQGKHQ